jgi:hypothetical protein
MLHTSEVFAADSTIVTTYGIPTGTLNVDRTLVREGSRSQLDWKINFPQEKITLTPTEKVRVKIRVLGVAFQAGTTLLPFECDFKTKSTSWKTIFNGKGPSVEPTTVLVDQVVEAYDTLQFSGRGGANAAGSSWFPAHLTGTNDVRAVVLRNGESPPDYAPAYDQGTIKSFMSGFIDATGKIKIGENDLIILWEGSNAEPGTTYFDMQDLVVLVSYEAVAGEDVKTITP